MIPSMEPVNEEIERIFFASGMSDKEKISRLVRLVDQKKKSAILEIRDEVIVSIVNQNTQILRHYLNPIITSKLDVREILE